MAHNPKKEEEIFAAAIQIEDEAARQAYVTKACREDRELCLKLEALLQAHASSSLLDESMLGSAATLDSPANLEQPGTVIGRYKLLEKIGEGGMAVVYMAEQKQPLRRKVALKIIKLGMDSQNVIARFEAERQALALMDHPNIAKVFDAGTTDTGRPYFVMELVHGVSITEFCDQQKLPMAGRLQLFLEVCSAVQHAHQRGIIHRDLKPSNIMVTMHDDRAVPKVIDFGIAKATNQQLTEKTLFTRYAHMIGTPAYMSPEQAQMSGLDIDTRSDIYSLGVLLYELLTGTVPFPDKELLEAGYLEMQRIISEEEPIRPSTKLSTLGETITEVAQQRCCTPDVLRRTIRGDLDWIVMKALEKKRTRRYETASAFGRDVKRYLQHEPVEAHKPSLVYRMQKYLYRHRVHAIVSLAMGGLVCAMVIVFVMTYKDKRERARLADFDALSQARTAYARGDRKNAKEQAESILRSKYVGPEAKLLQATISADTGLRKEAKEMLDGLLEERPQIAGAAHVLLARIARENWIGGTKKLEEIEAYHLRQAKSLLPETAEAYFLRATIALSVKERLNLLSKGLWIDGSHYASYRLRAYIHYASMKYEDMEHDAIAMIAKQPQDPLGYSLRATALAKQGRHAQAITHYDHAIDLTEPSDPRYSALHARGCEVLLHMGEFELVIDHARACLEKWPDEMLLFFRIFCAHTALGEYEKASSLFQLAVTSDPQARDRFSYWSMAYVFDALEAGRLWHAAETKPEGIAFLAMLEAAEFHEHLSGKKARRLIGQGFSPAWSPDGTKLAFSLGVPGASALAVYDLSSNETEVLVFPGKDPRWSPDGRTIAFVRDCPMLDLSELTLTESYYQKRHVWDHEVWIINADGTEPRRLTSGGWPFWSKDSKSVYYNSLGRLCVISTEKEGTQSQVVLPSSASVSPDCRYASYVENASLQIKELSSQSLIDVCQLPRGLWGGQWAPRGQHILLGGLVDGQSRTGLWLYDWESKQLRKLLRGPITCACWSPDETSLTFSLAPPLSEIWLADLGPNVRETQTLDSDHTIEGHNQEMLRYYTGIINADPNHALSYFRRAQYHKYLDNTEQCAADIDKYVSTVNAGTKANAHDRWFRDVLITLWQSTPTNLGAPINTPKHDFGLVSPDGLSLFLESPRSLKRRSFDGWVATRPSVADSWGPPENLGSLINTENYESLPIVSKDNLSLYFTSIDGPNGFDPAYICVSTRETTDAPWNPPRKLGPAINSARWQQMGSISADELELYLASNRPSLDIYSDYDLWVSRRATRQDDWGMPVNLGPRINSPYEDMAPIISSDGLTLLFTSERPGGCGSRDIWVTTRSTRESPWREPINLGPPVNTLHWDQVAMISTADSMFYFSSWKPGGLGLSDIYKVPIPKLSDYASESND